MVLTYESDHCDNDQDDSDDNDDVISHEDTEEEKLVCGSDIDSNELSNADDEDDDDIRDNGDEETIDSQSETEAVNHIVTPSSARRCHLESLLLTTLLPIIFIIQR